MTDTAPARHQDKTVGWRVLTIVLIGAVVIALTLSWVNGERGQDRQADCERAAIDAGYRPVDAEALCNN